MRKGVTWGRLVLCLTLLMMLLAACTLVQAEESALPKNYRTIAENERFILGLDTSNCFFCVFDRALGQTYFSNPEDWKSDTQAVGSAKNKAAFSTGDFCSALGNGQRGNRQFVCGKRV